MRAPVRWQCHEGHTWSARPDNVLRSKTWCPVCAGKAPLDLGRLQEHAARRGGECLATEYVNNRSEGEMEVPARPHLAGNTQHDSESGPMVSPLQENRFATSSSPCRLSRRKVFSQIVPECT